jgi:hypothetical protein
MNCKNLRIRTKKGTKYKYCIILKKVIKDECYNCINKEYKTCSTIKKRSSKLAKMERKRFSVFTDDLQHCYLCGKPKEELHEIYAGRNRRNSMKYGFVLPLCHECHSLNQENPFFNDFWHKNGQEYYECNLGSREAFIEIFKKNYL